VLKTPAALSTDRKSRSHKNVEIPIQTIVTLTRDVPRIDIHTSLENRAKDHRLRVHFPTEFRLELADYDGHFEIIRRKIGIPDYDRQNWAEDPRPEVPQRAYTELSGAQRGITLANRGLPEVEVLKTNLGTEIALTLLRCVGWLSRDDLQTRRGHAGPGLETPGAQMPGNWDFDYSIIPHTDKEPGMPALQAYAFEDPLRAIATEKHSGELPNTGSFIRIEYNDSEKGEAGSKFIVSAIKQAENGSGWLVRGYNSHNKTLQIKLTPFKQFRSAAMVNLAEEKIGDLNMDRSNGSVNLQVNSQQIVSIWFGT
jgi:alpha-mannosidase